MNQGRESRRWVDILTLLLTPTTGKILVDGVDSRDIDLPSWRRQIGYVAQDSVIFDDTVGNNICLWRDDYAGNLEAARMVAEAAEQACASGFIDEMPKGYDTIVGDRGIRLSGGQKQRISLARELYKKPKLLILDEATSSLDSESEKYIQNSIDALKGNMTVIIIAHRLSTIKNVDYIYVIEKGKIIENGTYDKLIKIDDGKFSKMIKMQKL